MIPYLNFCKKLRYKHGGLGDVSLPMQDFREELNHYFYRHLDEGEREQAIKEMKFFGMIDVKGFNKTVVVKKHLLD